MSASNAWAHGSAEGPAEPFAPSEIRWEQHLRDFSAHGHAQDLERALDQLEYYESRTTNQPSRLYLAAWTMQASHQFDRAWYFTSRLRALDPGNTAALLLEAALWLVRGDYEQAGQVCRRLQNVDATMILNCQVQAIGHPDRAQCLRYSNLGRSMGRLTLPASAGNPGAQQGSIAAWLHGSLGDLAMRCGQPVEAEDHYRRAYAITPSVRHLVAQVTAMIQSGSLHSALAALPRDTEVPSLQVKRLVILKSLGRLTEVLHVVVELDARFSHDLAKSDYSHGREMAEFYLHVLDQPEDALVIAQQTLRVQRELEDLLVLQQVEERLLKRNVGSCQGVVQMYKVASYPRFDKVAGHC